MAMDIAVEEKIRTGKKGERMSNVNIQEIKFDEGVNILTGESSSGKTSLCKSIRQKIGLDPVFYSLGIRGLYSKYYIQKPSTSVEINNSQVSIEQMNSETVLAGYHKLEGERAILQSVITQTDKIIKKLISEIESLQKDIADMKAKEQLQYVHHTLSLMDSGECPLYPINCACQDEMVELTKQNLRQQVSDVPLIDKFFDSLRQKETQLAGKELRIEILNEGLKNKDGKSPAEQLAHIETQLQIGDTILKALKTYEAWKRAYDVIVPYLSVKDRLLAVARELGVNLAFDGTKYQYNGRNVECSSISEHILLGYALQQAADLSLIVVDDFGNLDLDWKVKILNHAKRSSKKIIVLVAASSQPKKIEGTSSWHLTGGALKKVA